MPAARVSLANSIAIPSGVYTLIAWNKEYFANAGTRTPAYPSRLIAPVAGLYHLNAEIGWLPQAGGTQRILGILKNFTQYLATLIADSPAPAGQACDFLRLATLAQLSAGDYVELVVFQDSGSFVTSAYFSNDQSPIFSLVSE